MTEHLIGLSKRVGRSKIVLVYRHKRLDRRMVLIPYYTRCIKNGEIHELVVATEIMMEDGLSGAPDVGYIGFIEFETGCIIVVGDRVAIGPRHIGQVVGFDETHFPNHLNIVVKAPDLVSGEELGANIEDVVLFTAATSSSGNTLVNSG